MTVPAAAGLDQFVEAFEAARRQPGRVDLADFLPPPADPLFLPVLRELVCVDLDYGWDRDEPTPLEEYRKQYPALFADPAGVRAVVWEDYRQRRLAGEEPDPEDYRRKFGVSPLDSIADFCEAAPGSRNPATDDADGPPTQVVSPDAVVAPSMVGGANGELAGRLNSLTTTEGAAELYWAARGSNPAAADRYARAMAALPRAGEMFAGFRLETVLGQGAFGRVFLARQIGLAERVVVLKVSTELFGEAQTLARLQHTNIVPIYSPHQVGPIQALCMPYLGTTTLADVVKALGGKAPVSGKELVSTLQGRKQSTVTGTASRGTHESGRREPTGHLTNGRAADPLSVDQGAHAPRSPDELSAVALAALERLSYPEAVLWLGVRLAAGLAHAHDRGIVHRDLKPANILLTDDGEPMLLDFNLAQNAAVRHSEAGARVGGTLPYMAPEQLRAFNNSGDRRAVDARSDIYSLGLILFELLTGRPSYPTVSSRGPDGLARMIADRSGPPPRLRPVNPKVSPAAEAIVRKCLDPDPARRYQTAHDLREDIERHLNHLPLKHTPEPSARERLRKWAARHPRLTSGTAIAALAAVVLIGVGVGAFALNREMRRRDAADGLRTFFARTDADMAPLIRSTDADRGKKAVTDARQAVAAYHIFDRPDWQADPVVQSLTPAGQDRLRSRLVEVLFLIAQAESEQPNKAADALRCNDLAAACLSGGESPPKAWWEQRANLLAKLDRTDEASRAAAEADRRDVTTTTDRYLRGLQLYNDGRMREAVPLLVRATADEPKHFWAWFLRGNCHAFLGQDRDAVQCYGRCIDLDPAQARAYFNCARVEARLKDFLQAYVDADRATKVDPDWADGQIEAALLSFRLALFLDRRVSLPVTRDELVRNAGAGLTLDRTKLLSEAEDRLTKVLQRPDAPTRCYLIRAQVRRIIGNKAGADQDDKQGLDREPAADDALSWIARGLTRMEKEPNKALADFRRAEAINPRSFSALQNQSHVLMNANRHEENLAVLNRLLTLYPDHVEGRAGRAVQYARLGRTKDALADAEWVRAHSADPLMTYQMAGVYAQVGQPQEALRLLAWALTHGVGYDDLPVDPDLDPIRSRPEFGRLAEAVRTLRELLKPPEANKKSN
jgi:serine/threonine protein kinase/Flp pilus assembly protein TadD